MEQTVTAPDAGQSSLGQAGLVQALRGLLVPVLAVFTAVVIGAVFVLLAGFDPIKAYSSLLRGSLGSDAALTRSLLKMTPLILSGLA